MKIGSKFMQKVLCGILKKTIKKQFGCEVDIRIKYLTVDFQDDGKAHVGINADAEMASGDLKALVLGKVGI